MDSKVLVGGMGEEKPADQEIQCICDSVKSEFMKQSGVNATEYKADRYTSQVVNGTNYFVKVWLGGDEYCTMRIHKPLPYTGEPPRLDGYQLEKTKEDPIVYF